MFTWRSGETYIILGKPQRWSVTSCRSICAMQLPTEQPNAQRFQGVCISSLFLVLRMLFPLSLTALT